LSGFICSILPPVAFTGSIFTLVLQVAMLILLMIASAFVSGSEVAYFSLTPTDIEELEHTRNSRAVTAIKLLSRPEKLLSSILVTNNIINIALIILAAFISSRLFDLSNNPILSFIMEVVVITFLLLLFCEVMPKVYASRHQLRFTLTMAPSLALASRIVSPLASALSFSSFFVKKR
jgi:CBS domain containing-hemolysin-like protein